jgi:hypothetical protein
MPLISANRSRPGPVPALRRRPVALTSRAWLVYSRVQFLSMCSADAQPLDDRGAGPPGDLPEQPLPAGQGRDAVSHGSVSRHLPSPFLARFGLPKRVSSIPITAVGPGSPNTTAACSATAA